MNNLNDKSRYPIIDFIRGFTIILMIFFHASFDLNHFGFIHVDIIHGKFWYFLPRLIVFLFFFAVGMSLKVVHGEKIRWKHFNQRLIKLIFFALLISVVTYFLFPDNWIYFGTLHSIALCSILSLPFLKHEKLALIVALALFIPSIFFDYNLPFFELPFSSFDYISPFPWVGAPLLGIFAVKKNFHLKTIPEHKLTKYLNYLGKNSLVIYLIHQPILFGIIALIFKIKG